MSLLGKVQNSKAAKGLMSRAKSVASSVKHRMDEAAANYTASPRRRPPTSDLGSSVAEFEEALNAAETAAIGPRVPPENVEASGSASGSDTTLQEAKPSKKVESKVALRKGSQDEIPAKLLEQEQRQTADTRSDAYFSDDDDEGTIEDEV